MRGFLLAIFEIFKIFLIVAVIVIPIRYFLFQPFFVSGASMEPNFSPQEYLLIDEITYRFREPRRGEVVVFRAPQSPSYYFIKRIIGLPGETIEIKDGSVIIYNLDWPHGKMLEEPYIQISTPGLLKIDLKKNEYFVLGDNRNHSSDSRAWGGVPRENIIGKVWLTLSLGKGLEVFRVPVY